jgi:hypothetical protein
MSIENNRMHAMLDEMGDLLDEKIGPGGKQAVNARKILFGMN